jgi:hypothetical protein
MKPPIFALDRDGELTVFATRHAAEHELEVNDLEGDEHTFYDAEGRLLNARPHPTHNQIVLEDAEPLPTHREDLHRALLASLPRFRGAPKDMATWDVETLVRFAGEYALGR